MIHELIEKEASALRGALNWVRGRVHPKQAMKRHEFDRPLDDLGQNIDDVERRAEPQEGARSRTS